MTQSAAGRVQERVEMLMLSMEDCKEDENSKPYNRGRHVVLSGACFPVTLKTNPISWYSECSHGRIASVLRTILSELSSIADE